MDRNYDLFEILPDGSPLWKCAVAGHENAVQQLRELAKHTDNEVRIMHLATNTLIAVLNAPPHSGDTQDRKTDPQKAPEILRLSARIRICIAFALVTLLSAGLS